MGFFSSRTNKDKTIQKPSKLKNSPNPQSVPLRTPGESDGLKWALNHAQTILDGYQRLDKRSARLAGLDSIYADRGRDVDAYEIVHAIKTLEEFKTDAKFLPANEPSSKVMKLSIPYFELVAQLKMLEESSEKRLALSAKESEFKDLLYRAYDLIEDGEIEGYALYAALSSIFSSVSSFFADFQAKGYTNGDLLEIEAPSPLRIYQLQEKIKELSDEVSVAEGFLYHFTYSTLASGGINVNPSNFKALALRMMDDLVLVKCESKIEVHPLFEKFEVKPLLYKLPAVLLARLEADNARDVLELEGLSPSVIETLLVLYGGTAYSTLEEAKNGAMALEEQ